MTGVGAKILGIRETSLNQTSAIGKLLKEWNLAPIF
jgi:hypothetical protein